MAGLVPLPLAATALLAIYLITIHISRESKSRSLGCKDAPLFRPWDILGTANFRIELNGMRTHRLSNAFRSRKEEISKTLGRETKTFRIKYPPGETWYYTFDPRTLKAVLATQFQDFQQPKARVDALEPLLGRGIFSANGPQWEHSRALLKPQFMREQIADLTLFEKHFQSLLHALPSTTAHDGDDLWTANFDLQPFLERFTMDVATEFLFGESVYSQKEDSDSEMSGFVETFYKAEKTTAKSMILSDLYWLLHNRDFKEQCKSVHDFVDNYILRRMDSQRTGFGKYVVLDALIADTQDSIDLRSQLLNILLAGSDTISGTLGFVVATLAQYPQIFEKLRGIVLQKFGRTEEITISSLKNCSYLQWFLYEILRVYPVVPVNFREAVRDTTIPFGGGQDGNEKVFVPKGYLVAWELWTMHSDPEFWGPDADQFIPERWERRKLGFEYLPFNAGPRICIGQQFALAEVGYVTVRLLQEFDGIDGKDLPQGRLPCDWKLVDKVAGGVNVRLRRAAVAQ
ncbi:Cytochrome P450 52A8 [Pseudocercospora fuligena]|uniref:Cytochrome P450 52A8 n=1 Tax=Pseudocercospora fuligena TaxID=685502 RepID=A0A8H6RV14_9PEZI|nr:Cytochrome P450 52A8 [Pseudocercospora fuligena]